MAIKAIDTVYNGYRFRSRTEARVAIFFDVLHIVYEYEKEGYILPDGTWYLPDFWLPELNCFIEVKGKEPTQEERRKARLLAQGTGKTVYILWGDMQPFWCEGGKRPYHGLLGHRYSLEGNGIRYSDTFWFFTECPECGLIEPSLCGFARFMSCDCIRDEDFAAQDYYHNTPKLAEAYIAARQARFGRSKKRP